MSLRETEATEGDGRRVKVQVHVWVRVWVKVQVDAAIKLTSAGHQSGTRVVHALSHSRSASRRSGELRFLELRVKERHLKADGGRQWPVFQVFRAVWSRCRPQFVNLTWFPLWIECTRSHEGAYLGTGIFYQTGSSPIPGPGRALCHSYYYAVWTETGLDRRRLDCGVDSSLGGLTAAHRPLPVPSRPRPPAPVPARVVIQVVSGFL